MPQNPVKTTLFVSQVKAGSGLAVTPSNGTGIVTLSMIATMQVNLFANAGVPTNGTGGTLNGVANPGDLLVDTTDKTLYQNTNTKASPTWTIFESSGGAGSFTTLNVSGLTTLAGAGSSVPQQAYNAVSTAPTTNNLNLTGANIAGGSVETWLNLTTALGAGATATLPSVASLVAAMAAAGLNPVAGGSYILNLQNTSSGNFAWTITVDSGATFTLTGTMTVAQNTYRKCLIKFTSLTAATLQSLGEFAITGVI